MKWRIPCLLYGGHDWPRWTTVPSREKQLDLLPTMGVHTITPRHQVRICRRCKKREVRAVPITFTLPKAVSQVKVTVAGGGGGGAGGGGGNSGSGRAGAIPFGEDKPC